MRDSDTAAVKTLTAIIETLPWGFQREAHRIHDLTIDLIRTIEYGLVEAITDEARGAIAEALDDIQRVQAIRQASPEVTPARAFALAWDDRHLQHCPGCDFSCHEGDPAAAAEATAASLMKKYLA